MEQDAQRRREEARKRHEAAERKQRQIDRERADSTNYDIRTGAENSFFVSPNNGGIMEPQKPKYSSIQQIKDAKDAQIKQLEDLREKQWGDLSTGTDEIQIINTQNVERAKQGLVDLDSELTDAVLSWATH